MDFNLIRTFVTLAREGNLTRTAQRLHLSQPALSLQLKKLHEQLGLVLFERTPRGMRLTRAGEQLLPAAQRALEAATELDSLAAGISGQVGGRLRIGTIVDPEFLRLGPFLKRLVEYHPGLSTDLAHGMSGAVRRDVAANRLDVAYTLGLPGMSDVDAGFEVLTLTGFNYRVIAPPGWQERVRGKDWKELARLPWIGTPPESAHHRLLAGIFHEAGQSPRIVAQVDLEPSMLDLVRSGVGLSLARDSIALRAAHAGGIVIADRVEVPAELGFLCLRERRKEAAIAAAFIVIGSVWTTA
ncbi:MAG: LysR family transcriptional regulator [Pseudomonadota bacterium]